jgi:hypothetical protein
MNRFRIWDSLLLEWKHIAYDSRDSARRAAAKMEECSGCGKSVLARRSRSDRYRVIDAKKRDVRV